MTPGYEVYAIKYAHHARRASENFIGGDPHDGPMPLDYFVWLVRGGGRELVVDTGFSPAMAAKRGREHLRCPTHGLRLLGVDAASVKDVVISLSASTADNIPMSLSGHETTSFAPRWASSGANRRKNRISPKPCSCLSKTRVRSSRSGSCSGKFLARSASGMFGRQ